MIDDKKIEAAAFEEYPLNSDGNIIGRNGFKEGAKWAIKAFLEGLWHQTNKEPEGYDEWILLHYNVGNYYSLAQVKDFKSWKGFVERAPIENWLYIDDLESKEGGECK
jgi:hypothetical protein